MIFKVLPLEGYESHRAMQVFYRLMLGLKYLPAYAHEDFHAFMRRVDQMPHEDQIVMIREAVTLVRLEDEEIADVLKFCADKNGVPFGKVNSKKLTPLDVNDMLISVCSVIAKIRIDSITETEKKNSLTSV